MDKLKKQKVVLIGLIAIFTLIFVLLMILQLTHVMDNINHSIGQQGQAIENAVLTKIIIVVTNFGEWYFYVPCIIILLIIPKTRWFIGLPEAVLMIISTILNTLLKVILKVERPNYNRLISISGYSFPSGHAMHSMVFIGVLFVLLFSKNLRQNLKIVIVFLGAFFVLLIGWTRIYLGVHTITDILAGYSIGLALVFVFVLFKDKVFKKKKKIVEVEEKQVEENSN